MDYSASSRPSAAISSTALQKRAETSGTALGKRAETSGTALGKGAETSGAAPGKRAPASDAALRKRGPEELKALQSAKARRTMPVLAMLENVRSMFNVGSFFRTVDGAGGAGLVLTGFTAHPPRKEIAKVALGAEEVVPWEHIRDPIEAARSVKARGYRLLAVEQTTGGRELYSFKIPFPCCLVFGHEVEGVSEALLGECDGAVEVPMYGTKESLNVAVCAGVVLFEVRRQFDQMGKPSSGG